MTGQETPPQPCSERRTVGRSSWVCCREHHDAGNVYQDAARRRIGKVPQPDRHYFVAAS